MSNLSLFTNLILDALMITSFFHSRPSQLIPLSTHIHLFFFSTLLPYFSISASTPPFCYRILFLTLNVMIKIVICATYKISFSFLNVSLYSSAYSNQHNNNSFWCIIFCTSMFRSQAFSSSSSFISTYTFFLMSKDASSSVSLILSSF